MLCQLTFHRRLGLGLAAGQIEPPIFGLLSLDTLPAQDSFKRVDSPLVLLEPCGSTYRTAATLVDLVLIQLRDGAMVFRGLELISIAKENMQMDMFEYVQVWQCKPVAQADGKRQTASFTVTVG